MPERSERNGYKYENSQGFTAVDVLDYIYAILYSDDYRIKYKNQLKIDFPRIPYPKNSDYFFDIASKGKKLRNLHLMHEELDTTHIIFVPGESTVVDAPKYKSGTIILNKLGAKFIDIPSEIWNMGLGGYQPLQKWLKDRKGKYLSQFEIEHYKQMIAILMATRDIVKTINL